MPADGSGLYHRAVDRRCQGVVYRSVLAAVCRGLFPADPRPSRQAAVHAADALQHRRAGGHRRQVSGGTSVRSGAGAAVLPLDSLRGHGAGAGAPAGAAVPVLPPLLCPRRASGGGKALVAVSVAGAGHLLSAVVLLLLWQCPLRHGHRAGPRLGRSDTAGESGRVPHLPHGDPAHRRNGQKRAAHRPQLPADGPEPAAGQPEPPDRGYALRTARHAPPHGHGGQLSHRRGI